MKLTPEFVSRIISLLFLVREPAENVKTAVSGDVTAGPVLTWPMFVTALKIVKTAVTRSQKTMKAAICIPITRSPVLTVSEERDT